MPPSASRVMFRPGPEGLEIVIPAVRNWVIILFLGAWLIGWGVGETTAVAAFFSGSALSKQGPFLLIWLVFWTMGGLFALATWLWIVAGAERLTMGSSTLTIQRSLCGVGPSRAYELHRIHNLRVLATQAAPRDANRLGPWGITKGRVAFQYGERQVRFGAGVGDGDAQAIVERMKARFAFAEMPVLVGRDDAI